MSSSNNMSSSANVSSSANMSSPTNMTGLWPRYREGCNKNIKYVTEDGDLDEFRLNAADAAEHHEVMHRLYNSNKERKAALKRYIENGNSCDESSDDSEYEETPAPRPVPKFQVPIPVQPTTKRKYVKKQPAVVAEDPFARLVALNKARNANKRASPAKPVAPANKPQSVDETRVNSDDGGSLFGSDGSDSDGESPARNSSTTSDEGVDDADFTSLEDAFELEFEADYIEAEMNAELEKALESESLTAVQKKRKYQREYRQCTEADKKALREEREALKALNKKYAAAKKAREQEVKALQRAKLAREKEAAKEAARLTPAQIEADKLARADAAAQRREAKKAEFKALPQAAQRQITAEKQTAKDKTYEHKYGKTDDVFVKVRRATVEVLLNERQSPCKYEPNGHKDDTIMVDEDGTPMDGLPKHYHGYVKWKSGPDYDIMAKHLDLSTYHCSLVVPLPDTCSEV